jgi:hypothetical protein
MASMTKRRALKYGSAFMPIAESKNPAITVTRHQNGMRVSEGPNMTTPLMNNALTIMATRPTAAMAMHPSSILLNRFEIIAKISTP